MNISIENLNNLQLDVLKEIGNIGAGNAATALAKLLNKRIDMTIPKVQIVEFKNLANIIGGADNTVVGVILRVTGDITGYIMFILEKKYAHMLVNILMGNKINDFSEFNEIKISAMKEIGNILAGSYISSLSALTNLNIVSSIPDMAIDMAGAILSVPAIEFGKVGDTVLFIETEFNEQDYKMIGNFFLIPDVNSYSILLKALGVEV